jgi:hypothetical protein
MATGTPTATEPGQEMTVEEKISQLRKLFGDAPEVGRTALEKVLGRLASDALSSSRDLRFDVAALEDRQDAQRTLTRRTRS